MALDPELRNQLIEASQRIHAQLDEIEQRILPGSNHGGGGAPDFLTVLKTLVDQLQEIDRLLADDSNARQS